MLNPLLAALAACLAVVQTATAANLLVNPSFEQNSGHVIPTGWMYYAPPGGGADYWVEGKVLAEDGLLYYKEWSALNVGVTNVSGIYESFSSAAGSTYLASGWIYSDVGDNGGLGSDGVVWIEVSFLDGSGNLLALFKSDNYTAAVGLNTWFPYQVTNVCDITSPNPGGDPYFPTYAVTGTVSQIAAPVGTQTVRYRFALSQTMIKGSCYFDAAVLNQVSGPVPPAINNLFPLNMIFVNPSNGISFNVSSPSGFTINNSSIGLILNGQNVSSSLNISGSSSNKNVAYNGLQSNTVYNASITVTDSFNLTASANSYFETTWVGVPPILYLWEAEDFDFDSGMYYDFPTLCNTTGMSNCYFGTVGVEAVDEHNIGTAPNHQYRPNDAVGTLIAGDYNRPDHYSAGVFDYRIDPLNNLMWLNYTRDWSNGTYWVVGRLSTDVGLDGTLDLSIVSASTTNDLGTFTINGGKGWSSFEDIYLKDINGNNALVTLNGKETLRLTSGGNLLPNFFMLVTAAADVPLLTQMYPTGTHPFEYTNGFSFTVSTFSSTFPPGGIRVNFDGNDVTSNLVITGSSSNTTVLYPTVLPNARHVAILSITNALGHGILVTNNFDTFSEANYMVECEDFDYNGGQHLDDYIPDAYAGFGATTNIDFQHTTLTGQAYAYRAGGIPEDLLNPPPNHYDWVRSNLLYWGGIDYVLTFFAGGDWANYTHTYPTGSFYAYIRTSGDGPYSMYLDQVVSGATTTNQVTKRLGHFAGVGKNYTTYDWAPLTDDGLAAPAVVTLNGLATLRLTTAGNCNPNFFMLVPTGGIRVTATSSAGNIALSFPTQAGVNYRVFYKTNLATGTWTLLTSVLGNGAVQTVNDPLAGSGRFYKVTAP